MPAFAGFRDDDFETLEGISWRGRDALGGVLTRALRPRLGAGCQSWGVKRRVELHIARKSAYHFDNPVPVAKLFVYAYDELAFGFYVEATAKRDDDDKFVHWRNFRDRVQSKSSLRDALECAAAKHDLLFTDYYQRLDFAAPLGRYHSSKGAIEFAPRGTDKWAPSSLAEFAKAVAAIPGTEWINLHICARLDKNAAIKMGRDVVGPILSVLDDLVPVYLETIS